MVIANFPSSFDLQNNNLVFISLTLPGMYFFAMVLMGCFSIIGTVIVLRVYHRGSDQPVPACLKGCLRKNNRKKYAPIDRKSPNRTGYTPGIHVEAHILELARQQTNSSVVSRSSPDGYSTPEAEENGGRDKDMSYKRKSDQEAVTKLVLRELRKSASKSQDQDKRDVIAGEWRELALFLDRIIFIAMFLVTMVIFLYVSVSFVAAYQVKR